MKLREEARRIEGRKITTLAAGIALAGILAAPPLALGQPKEQCSAQVQSGAIPNYHSKDKKTHLVSTPLMRPGKYLSLKIPERHMDKVVKAAKAKPEGERAAFVRDSVHVLIETALTKVGKGSSASFDCGSPEAKAAPAASVSPPAESAKAQPAASATPKAKAPPADAPRRRTITP